jgi:hypothetical protein
MEGRKRGRPKTRGCETIPINVRVSKDLLDAACVPGQTLAANIERALRAVIINEKPTLEKLYLVRESIVAQWQPLRLEMEKVNEMIHVMEEKDG